jgi:uncharacterized metal-binding protein YceD (DUF177 family)
MERAMTERDKIRLTDLSNRGATEFRLEPDAEARSALAKRLDIPAVRKLRFSGRIVPEGRRDWRLDADLGATVVQSCVVTLDPVTTRIDEKIERRYLADMPPAPEGSEIEMPQDDTAEPLPETLDLAEVMAEALALALPPFPRTEGAALGEAVFTEPGREPLTDEAVRPFAGLAGLRDKLAKGD